MTGLAVTPVPIERLHGNPLNRPDGSGDDDLDGLARTIRVLGVLQPLLVEPMPDRPGHYLIRAGHRRKAAAEKCGLSAVPCIIRRGIAGKPSAVTGALVAVVENFQRAALNPVELALQLGELRRTMSQADIARYTGMKDATISYHLELLDLDDATLNKVRRGEIPVGAAHEAVRAYRAAAPPPGPDPAEIKVRPRQRTGTRPAGGKPMGRPWFDATHPLAGDAATRCTQARHPVTVVKYGKVACGECWEAAITAAALAGGARERPRDPETVLRSLGLTRADLTEAARAALFSDVIPATAAPVPAFSGGRA